MRVLESSSLSLSLGTQSERDAGSSVAKERTREHDVWPSAAKEDGCTGRLPRISLEGGNRPDGSGTRRYDPRILRRQRCDEDGESENSCCGRRSV